MRTLYVSDLDGTLLNREQSVGEESIRILNDLIGRGLHFTIATARSMESALPLLERLHLKLPGIFINGVFIADLKSGQIIQSHYLPNSLGEEIVESYLQAGLKPVVYTVDHEGRPRVYYRGIHNASEEHYIGDRLLRQDGRFRLINDYSACLTEKLITINAIDLPEKLEDVYLKFANRPECIRHYGPDIYAPGYHWLEISSAQATKSQAVQYLKEAYGYERLVCFGDNLNDLSMFEMADECYAVGNAHDLVKKAATRIIDTHDHDGVARFLRERHLIG
ncbi:HAD hydrolase family protein [Cohnella sp. CFH 77786]|uniref:HAD family hydrolase n=1 Tax=Cohnella sp. CFH 77786 TaxID=2662265 RepID=UPI001C60E521|nr:HAD family hydrolase [Cohnella sp. CFH 77786]MBW5447588.1 HAD hydrolase family protein [Cohnella sp. CFH 77786]